MIKIYLSNLHCFEETSELSASDEPYVLVTAVDLASRVPIAGFPVPLPAFDVVRYGPFEDVDDGETHSAPGIAQPFWGVNGRAVALTDPDQAIFVVALMEHDAGRPGSLQGIVKGIVGGSVLGSISLDRGLKVARLLRDVSSALGTPSGPSLDQDDTVGDPQELRFSREELIRAGSGQTITRTLDFSGDGGRYALTFEARRPARVAFNPQDHFVVTMGNRILVIVNNGGVFGHDLVDKTIQPAFQLAGPPVAFNPQDHFVVTMGNRILVITKSGGVFGHDLAGNTIGRAFQLAGPPVAFNPQDHFVVTMGNRILVITKSGGVFGHDLSGNTIGRAFQLAGPPVAFNPQDHFVVTMGNRILVIVNNGGVFGHDLSGNTIGRAFKLAGPPVAFNPQDHFVVTMGNRILVITKSGDVFGHDLSGNTIGPAFQLA